MEWLLGSLWGGAPQTSNPNLQSSGPLSREVLLQFFEQGRQMLLSHDFKQHLKVGHEQGKSVQDLVNQGQARLFEGLGVRGSFGLDYLSKVRMQYANDAEMLRTFYEFVHLEERTLDEAELPESVCKSKYAAMDAVQEEMKEREAELAALSPEERNKEMGAMYKRFVESSTGQQPCCSHDAACSHKQEQQGPGRPMDAGQGGATMSEDEQLRFFESLSKQPAEGR